MREQLLAVWPSARNVQECIKKEAEAIDEAVFLAVHQPMRLLRRDVGAAGGTVARSEAHLLEEFLTPNLTEGTLILPIVGSSGVGKSHVIRWLDAQLRRRSDAGRRHIIRVPKASSLKGVLRLLLSGLEGPEFDELREALTSARDHLDPELAALQLQLSLKLRIRREGAAAKERLAAGKPKAGDRELATFGHPRMLPAVLGDGHLEEVHWLNRSDGKSGVIAQLAEQVTQQGNVEDDRRRHEFEAADFDFSGIDPADLSPRAKGCVGTLLVAGRAQQAAAVVNGVLDAAKNDLLQLGDNSLVELFGKVRAELHRREMELVFLVEDFAVLSGLQGALLQVMIAEAVRDGEQHLCTMRTAVAYTEGYMAKDTVLSRARSEWLLEDRPGDDAEIIRRIERLVGAYLNAARVGKGDLKAAYGSSEGEEGRWIPVGGKLEALEPDVRSVVSDFGESVDGYPLFPFNREAVRQLARRGSLDSAGELLFNPRYVINNLLKRVLDERPAFETGRFPSPQLADPLQSAEVIDAVNRRVSSREELGRYLMALRIWGGQPSSIAEAAAMPVSLYQAFGLAPLEFGVAPAPAPRPPSRGSRPSSGGHKPPTPVPEPLPLSEQEDPEEARWRDLLEKWAKGGTLEQRDARQIRDWLSSAVHAYLPTDLLLLRARLKPKDLLRAVYLPRSRGQGNWTPETAFVVVATEAELDDLVSGARVVRTLMALIRRYGIHKNWDYDGAEVDGGLVRRFLDSAAPRAGSFLRARNFQVEGEPLEPLVRGLLLGARMLGVKGASDRAGSSARVDALVALGDPPPDDAGGSWGELQKSVHASRVAWRQLLLELVGARQGGAATTHAIDASRLLPLLREATADWKLGQSPQSSQNDPGYRAFVEQFRDFKLGLPRAVREERKALADWAPRAIAWFGEEFDKSRVQADLRALLKSAKQQGLAPWADFPRLRSELSRLPGLALVEARDASKRLSGEVTTAEAAMVLATCPTRHLAASEQLMDLIDGFVRRLDQELTGREQSTPDDIVEGVVEGLRDELGGLETLCSGRSGGVA